MVIHLQLSRCDEGQKAEYIYCNMNGQGNLLLFSKKLRNKQAYYRDK